MNIKELRKLYPDEQSCREYFQKLLWPNGPQCPRCQSTEAYAYHRQDRNEQLYECTCCNHHFSLTSGTIFHATKLPLWVWLQALYSVLCSSKGVSSVMLAQWIGVSQKTSWRMLHGIRQLMMRHHDNLPLLCGTVEVDEKYVGGKPRYQKGVLHKRGSGTAKICFATAVERQGRVRQQIIERSNIACLHPFVTGTIDPSSRLMSDEHSAYISIGKLFKGHGTVKHGKREYARGDIYNNTAESFHATVERAKIGVYHWFSEYHLPRYLAEAAFRWNQRVLTKVEIRRGKNKGQIRNIMKRLPIIDMIESVLKFADDVRIRRSDSGGIRFLDDPVFGL